MDIKGKVIQSLGLQKGVSKAGKEWHKAELVIETEGQYPKKVKLSNMKNAENFANLKIGETCVFHVDVESREYQGKWYTEVNCYKWEAQNGYSLPDTPPQTTVDPPYSNNPQNVTYSDLGMPSRDLFNQGNAAPQSEEDLPF